ncbi:uncharacterized protein LOC126888447 isoform X42 [Diabrotica virgifera virgifera]|uniref:Uncharacterized protein n=1 Tax=Diabrotica virgifera virgifera TaxID=50390 RepID=A0ABM5KR95_DIAVI|nr:uncharacterized protein LOC126888447 isoform X42 [Diabrotica virgifera virgifera]
MKLKILISSFLLVGISQAALLGRQGILAQTANKLGLGNIISVNADAEANLLGNKVGVDGAVGIGGQGIGAHLSGDADVLGQKVNVHGDVLDGHAIDQHNHEVFRDNRGRQYTLQRQYIGSNSVLVRKYLDNGQIYVDGADQDNVLQHSQSGRVVISGNSGSNGGYMQQGGLLINRVPNINVIATSRDRDATVRIPLTGHLPNGIVELDPGFSGPWGNMKLDPGFAGPWRNMLLNIKRVSPLEWQEWLLEQKQRNRNLDLTLIEQWINQQHLLLKVDTAVIEGWIMQQQKSNPNFLYNWIINHQVPNLLGNMRLPGYIPDMRTWDGKMRLPTEQKVTPQVWQQWVIQQKQTNNVDLSAIENWIQQQQKTLNLNADSLEGWIMQQQQSNPSFLYNWTVKKQVPNLSVDFGKNILDQLKNGADKTVEVVNGVLRLPTSTNTDSVIPVDENGNIVLGGRPRDSSVVLDFGKNVLDQVKNGDDKTVEVINDVLTRPTSRDRDASVVLGGNDRPVLVDRPTFDLPTSRDRDATVVIGGNDRPILDLPTSRDRDATVVIGGNDRPLLDRPTSRDRDATVVLGGNERPVVLDRPTFDLPTSRDRDATVVIGGNDRPLLDLPTSRDRDATVVIGGNDRPLLDRPTSRDRDATVVLGGNDRPVVLDRPTFDLPTSRDRDATVVVGGNDRPLLDLPTSRDRDATVVIGGNDRPLLDRPTSRDRDATVVLGGNDRPVLDRPTSRDRDATVVLGGNDRPVLDRPTSRDRDATVVLGGNDRPVVLDRPTFDLPTSRDRDATVVIGGNDRPLLDRPTSRDRDATVVLGGNDRPVLDRPTSRDRDATVVLGGNDRPVVLDRPTFDLPTSRDRDATVVVGGNDRPLLDLPTSRDRDATVVLGGNDTPVLDRPTSRDRDATVVLGGNDRPVVLDRPTFDLPTSRDRDATVVIGGNDRPLLDLPTSRDRDATVVLGGNDRPVVLDRPTFDLPTSRDRDATVVISGNDRPLFERPTSRDRDASVVLDLGKNVLNNIKNGADKTVQVVDNVLNHATSRDRDSSVVIELPVSKDRDSSVILNGRTLPTTNIEIDPGFAGPLRNILSIKKVQPVDWQKWLIQQKQKNNIDITVIENWINNQHEVLKLDQSIIEAWIMQQQNSNPSFLYNWMIRKQIPNMLNENGPMVESPLNGKGPMMEPTGKLNVEKATPEVWQRWVIQQKQQNNVDLNVIENWINQQHQVLKQDVGDLEGWIIQQQRMNPSFLYNWIIRKEVPQISSQWFVQSKEVEEPEVSQLYVNGQMVESVEPSVWQQWLIAQKQKYNIDISVIENWINQQHQQMKLDVGYLEGWIMQQQNANANFLVNWIIKRQVPSFSYQWKMVRMVSQPQNSGTFHVWINNRSVEKVSPEVWKQWVSEQQRNGMDMSLVERNINQWHESLKVDLAYLEAWVMQEQQADSKFLYRWTVERKIPAISYKWKMESQRVQPVVTSSSSHTYTWKVQKQTQQ